MSSPEGRNVAALVRWLATEIHGGTRLPGSRLPPERTLAAQLGVHRSTVALAYDELRALGLVRRRQGSGTYVSEDLWGLTPDWNRYLAEGGFRPTSPLLQRMREIRLSPGIVDLTQSTLGPDLWPQLPLAPLESLMPSLLGYGDPFGHPALRRAIAAQYLRDYGLAVEPEAVLVTHGAQHALYLVARALLRPGDAVALEHPSLYYSLALLQSAGVRMLPLAMDADGIVPDALAKVIERHRPAMVWLNPTYHNPTATTLSLPRRREVLDICRRWNVPVLEDDAYGNLGVDSDPPPPLKVLDEGQRVIHVSTLSKIVAPGLRIGWILAPKPLLQRLADVRGQIDIGDADLVQVLAASFLDSAAWPRHRAAVRGALRQRRDALAAFAEARMSDDLTVTLPRGGLFAWLSWRRPDTDQARLERAAAAGVVYAPGRIYGMPDGYGRINYVTEPPPRLQQGLEALGRI